MTMATDVPKDGFRLSMLIYDTRYRSYTIQLVVLVLFALAVAWLLNNTVQNLAARGKEFNYAFLWQRAGYDIGQHLIPYTNDSTHFRALLVGLITRWWLPSSAASSRRSWVLSSACCGCRTTGSSAG